MQLHKARSAQRHSVNSSDEDDDDDDEEDSSTEAECNAKPIKKERRKKQSITFSLAPFADAPETQFARHDDSTDARQTPTSNNNNNNSTLKDHLHSMQFSRSSVGGSKYLANVHANRGLSSDDLAFESRFESGNLAKAIKVTPVYYELYLRPDLYTNKHAQWFYFRVTNTRKNCSYRFVLTPFDRLSGWKEANHSFGFSFVLGVAPSTTQNFHSQFNEIGQPVHGGNEAVDVFNDGCQRVCHRMETLWRQYFLF